MLSLSDHDPIRNTRRAFLQVGAAGLASLFPGTLPPAIAAQTRKLLTGRSVIFLFLHGGPSQFETFDPKMSAPEGIRSATGEIPTRIPGITFGSHFPGLATRAHQLTLVRSFVPGDADHNIKPIVHRDTFGASLGSIYSRIAGTNRPSNGIPTNILLFPRAVDPTTQPGISTFGRFDSTGILGATFAPFDPSNADPNDNPLTLSIPRTRLDDRRHVLDQLDRLERTLDRMPDLPALNALRDQAYTLLEGGLAAAFDLAREDPKLIARYDTAHLTQPESSIKKWNNWKNYTDNARALGKLLLLARRLCEQGAGFVTVTTNFVWDMHADVNNAPMIPGMNTMAPPLDHALSAFLDDTAARGLADKILLVACGEMGRTPRINAQGGRDHWGNLGPLLLAGGGLPPGHVLGRSNRDGSAPQSEPITLRHLIATILHALVDIPTLRLEPNLPPQIAQIMASWDPIPFHA